MPTWTIYLVRCSDGSLYAGMTNDLAKRVAAHSAGKGAKYTRSRRPVQLVWHEEVQTATEARKAEAAIKRLSRKEKESLILAGNRGIRLDKFLLI